MAEPAAAVRPMTFEDAALLDPDREGGEVVEGEWSPVSRNTWRHGEIVHNLSLILGLYARSQPGWRVAVGDPGARLRRDPDTLRGPDVAMIRQERVPEGRGVEGWLRGAPDVAVEVLGDGQSMSELLHKAQEYIDAGSRMVWLADPDAGRLVLVTPPNQFRILQGDDAVDGGDVLPGFQCRVAELFE